MALTYKDQECLERLRALFYRAHSLDHPVSDLEVLTWGDSTDLWAEQQIRYRGWGFAATEAVVREARIVRGRARRAFERAQKMQPLAAHAGVDPFDALMPVCTPDDCATTEAP